MPRIVPCLFALLVAASLAGCEKDRAKEGAPPAAGEGEGTTPGAAAPDEGAAASAAEPPVAPAVVFLGDSLTAGHGLPADAAMPVRVGEKIEQAGLAYRVINAGRSGDTTAGGLSRLAWYLRDEVNVTALIVGLGSNDAMRGLPLAEMERNLREIARRTRAYDPDIDIFLFQMKTFPNMGKEYAGAYEEVFSRVAEEESMTLLPFPLEDVAAVPALNQADGIHPNLEGTEKMADSVWSALAPHLED